MAEYVVFPQIEAGHFLILLCVVAKQSIVAGSILADAILAIITLNKIISLLQIWVSLVEPCFGIEILVIICLFRGAFTVSGCHQKAFDYLIYFLSILDSIVGWVYAFYAGRMQLIQMVGEPMLLYT